MRMEVRILTAQLKCTEPPALIKLTYGKHSLRVRLSIGPRRYSELSFFFPFWRWTEVLIRLSHRTVLVWYSSPARVLSLFGSAARLPSECNIVVHTIWSSTILEGHTVFLSWHDMIHCCCCCLCHCILMHCPSAIIQITCYAVLHCISTRTSTVS